MTRARHNSSLLVCLALVALAAGACRRSRSTDIAVVDPAEGRFPHPKHRDLACTECHDPAAVLSGEPARPGADDHAPCDRDRCHRAEFLRAPGPLCEMCHDKIGMAAGATTLAPYPPASGGRSLASEFSHRQHLNFDAMEKSVGFHVSCTDCHDFQTEGGELSAPNHAVCGRCHAPEAAPKGSPSLVECDRCHQQRVVKPARKRTLIVGDLVFAHGPHRTDRRGKLIRCAECHTSSAKVAVPGDHEPPQTKSCVGCHDDEKRTPPVARMKQCETCHATRAASIGALAPRSHLPATERPADHTLAFRQDHAIDVERDAPRCARCHTFLSGSRRDVCDECHQVMPPRSHVVTWREYDHGPEASARSDGCARCHGGDFCIACHSVPPRSHQPVGRYGEMGEHATDAMIRPRSCVACHEIGEFCRRCHRVRR